MQHDLETALVTHCAATLARKKPGSLFRYRYASWEAFAVELAGLRETLREKGVEIRVMKAENNASMLYVYRPSMLVNLVALSAVNTFLSSLGYQDAHEPEGYLDQLQSRITGEKGFPHEIGIFLGYPLADVKGFMEHHGLQYRCLGCWKAYGDEENACKLFTLYAKCKRIYQARYKEGKTLSQLTIANG